MFKLGIVRFLSIVLGMLLPVAFIDMPGDESNPPPENSKPDEQPYYTGDLTAIPPSPTGTLPPESETDTSEPSGGTTETKRAYSTETAPQLPARIPNSHRIYVDYLPQNPELPTGSEITAFTTVLNYYGYGVDKLTMADEYLNKAEPGTSDFNTHFLGNPRDASSYGCYAPVIMDTAEKFFNDTGNSHSAYNLTGSDFRQLLPYVAADIPVVVWTTISLEETSLIELWEVEGRSVYWLQNEHCVVLIGYNVEERYITVSDPLRGIVRYEWDRFVTRYNDLGKQSIIVAENSYSNFD